MKFYHISLSFINFLYTLLLFHKLTSYVREISDIIIAHFYVIFPSPPFAWSLVNSLYILSLLHKLIIIYKINDIIISQFHIICQQTGIIFPYFINICQLFVYLIIITQTDNIYNKNDIITTHFFGHFSINLYHCYACAKTTIRPDQIFRSGPRSTRNPDFGFQVRFVPNFEKSSPDRWTRIRLFWLKKTMFKR